jgi:hypothetical protein
MHLLRVQPIRETSHQYLKKVCVCDVKYRFFVPRGDRQHCLGVVISDLILAVTTLFVQRGVLFIQLPSCGFRIASITQRGVRTLEGVSSVCSLLPFADTPMPLGRVLALPRGI